MRHILITRFNVRVPEWRRVDKNKIPTLNNAWMKHRFKLFEKHTIPSVEAQTCQDFKWLLLCDANTSDYWMAKLFGHTAYGVIYVRDWLKDLQEHLKDKGWLATTRLDNDDAIEPEFIETIQKHLTHKKQFLNITNGWKLNGSRLRRVQHPANPFATYVEKGNKTVYHVPHGRAMRPIKQLPGRLWTQVIHERNYIND